MFVQPSRGFILNYVTFRSIDDVISLQNYKFYDYVDRIYPTEHKIKDNTDTTRLAS